MSGEDGGHTMSFSPFMPTAANDADVFLVTWDDALSCIKIILFQESTVVLFVPREKVVTQKLHILFSHFWIFRDPKDAAQLSPLIPAQNMTPPPYCWDMVAIQQSSTTPSIWIIRAHIGEHDCLKMNVFMHFRSHCSGFCMWALFRGGRIEGLRTTASLWTILHLPH